VVSLNRRSRAVRVSPAFDHVGVDRALGQEFRPGNAAGFFLENFDEDVANNAAFFLRIGHTP
jgi:hypothetical protein